MSASLAVLLRPQGSGCIGNQGLGFWTAQHLAARNADVGRVCVLQLNVLYSWSKASWKGQYSRAAV